MLFRSESIEKAGISSYEIEKKYGVKSAQSKLSQLKEGKTKSGKEKTLPSDLLSAVCSAREDINPDYILTGRGTPSFEWLKVESQTVHGVFSCAF